MSSMLYIMVPMLKMKVGRWRPLISIVINMRRKNRKVAEWPLLPLSPVLSRKSPLFKCPFFVI